MMRAEHVPLGRDPFARRRIVRIEILLKRDRPGPERGGEIVGRDSIRLRSLRLQKLPIECRPRGIVCGKLLLVVVVESTGIPADMASEIDARKTKHAHDGTP